MSSDFLCFIDFGCEHIGLLIAKIKDDRLIDIPLILNNKVNISSQRPQSVFNQQENVEEMLKIINEAEKKLKITINEIVLLSKNNAMSVYYSKSIIEFKKKQKVLQHHKERLSMKIIKSFYEDTNNNQTMLDYIQNNSILDDIQEVKNPYKMVCQKLSTSATIIGIKKIFINKISSFLEVCKIHIKHYISPSIAVYSLLKNNISNDNCYLFIDLGSISTEYCVVKNNCIICLENINLGGLDMTRDISDEMKIYIKDADLGKKKIGHIKQLNKEVEFVFNRMEEIADARLNEIVEYIQKTLNDKKQRLSFKKIYVFGGTSLYKNTKKNIEEKFKTEVEIINDKSVLNSELLYNKIKTEDMKKENIQLFGALNFYLNNVEMYKNASKGFLFKIPSKISCFLKDLLY